ncbi:MAG: tetratricopeptide repeat protein [Oleiphilus sp.]
MNLITRLTIISVFTVVSACSTGFGFQDKNHSSENQDQSASTSTKANKPKLKDFDLDKDTLFDLMVAEVAAQRNQLNITLLNYIQQAHMTRDPEIIKRAINAAQYAKDIEAIKEMALLWSDVEPDNIPAHQLLAFQYFYSKDYSASVEELEKILALDGDPRIDTLAIGSQALPDEDKQEILTLFQSLYESYPSYHLLPYSIAFLHKQLKEYELALTALEPAFKLAPEFSGNSVLKTNILYDQNKLEAAISFAAEAFDQFPNDHNLGRLYASMLVENKQLDEAEDVFSSLIDLYPQAPSLKLSLGLVKLENQKIDDAKAIFQELLEAGIHTNETNFYLGRIADQAEDFDLAIKHYTQIKDGPNYESAIERVSFLLMQQKKTADMIAYLAELRASNPEKSKLLWLLEVKLLSLTDNTEQLLSSLDKALAEFPDDDQLLYARAMNLDADEQLEKMEADLRKILSHKPENAIALNALGYTLADKTTRHEEAFKLIQKAHSLEPENPAILDSMGWVLFKLGQRENALIYLLKAFQGYQDGEVAAHLGEVLWSLNQKTEAFEVWFNVLAKDPEHPILLETINRIAPDALLEFQNKLNKLETSATQPTDNDNTESPENHNTETEALDETP